MSVAVSEATQTWKLFSVLSSLSQIYFLNIQIYKTWKSVDVMKSVGLQGPPCKHVSNKSQSPVFQPCLPRKGLLELGALVLLVGAALE